MSQSEVGSISFGSSASHDRTLICVIFGRQLEGKPGILLFHAFVHPKYWGTFKFEEPHTAISAALAEATENTAANTDVHFTYAPPNPSAVWWPVHLGPVHLQFAVEGESASQTRGSFAVKFGHYRDGDKAVLFPRTAVSAQVSVWDEATRVLLRKVNLWLSAARGIIRERILSRDPLQQEDDAWESRGQVSRTLARLNSTTNLGVIFAPGGGRAETTVHPPSDALQVDPPGPGSPKPGPSTEPNAEASSSDSDSDSDSDDDGHAHSADGSSSSESGSSSEGEEEDGEDSNSDSDDGGTDHSGDSSSDESAPDDGGAGGSGMTVTDPASATSPTAKEVITKEDGAEKRKNSEASVQSACADSASVIVDQIQAATGRAAALAAENKRREEEEKRKEEKRRAAEEERKREENEKRAKEREALEKEQAKRDAEARKAEEEARKEKEESDARLAEEQERVRELRRKEKESRDKELAEANAAEARKAQQEKEEKEAREKEAEEKRQAAEKEAAWKAEKQAELDRRKREEDETEARRKAEELAKQEEERRELEKKEREAAEQRAAEDRKRKEEEEERLSKAADEAARKQREERARREKIEKIDHLANQLRLKGKLEGDFARLVARKREELVLGPAYKCQTSATVSETPPAPSTSEGLGYATETGPSVPDVQIEDPLVRDDALDELLRELDINTEDTESVLRQALSEVDVDTAIAEMQATFKALGATVLEEVHAALTRCEGWDEEAQRRYRTAVIVAHANMKSKVDVLVGNSLAGTIPLAALRPSRPGTPRQGSTEGLLLANQMARLTSRIDQWRQHGGGRDTTPASSEEERDRRVADVFRKAHHPPLPKSRDSRSSGSRGQKRRGSLSSEPHSKRSRHQSLDNVSVGSRRHSLPRPNLDEMGRLNLEARDERRRARERERRQHRRDRSVSPSLEPERSRSRSPVGSRIVDKRRSDASSAAPPDANSSFGDLNSEFEVSPEKRKPQGPMTTPSTSGSCGNICT